VPGSFGDRIGGKSPFGGSMGRPLRHEAHRRGAMDRKLT
jgi:hypothetical protein